LVEFFAPWCGHCKTLAPEYEIVGEAFERHSDRVVIAKVDADKHRDLGSRFEVHGFPTLKYFPKSTKPKPYEGGRTADDIISWINKEAGTNAKVKKAASFVNVLDPSNFDSIALNPAKFALVEFYAPWCGHCKHLAPIYEKLAAVFANEPNVVIANVDADKHSELGRKYDVSGFPTIKFFGKDNKIEDYEAGRELSDFVAYINEKVGTQRKDDGKLHSNAGTFPALNTLASKFFSTQESARQEIIKEANTFVKTLSEEAQKLATYYVKVMETISSKGNDFISSEKARINRMMEGSISLKKVDELTLRLNVLNTFA